MKNLSPACLGEIFISTSLVHLHNLRGSAFIPRPLSEAGKRSFYYRGATLWNGLPFNTKKSVFCVSEVNVFEVLNFLQVTPMVYSERTLN